MQRLLRQQFIRAIFIAQRRILWVYGTRLVLLAKFPLLLALLRSREISWGRGETICARVGLAGSRAGFFEDAESVSIFFSIQDA